MTLSAKGQFTGLMTAVSELTAPPGSLCKADNVVIRKPGAIENRQAFFPGSAGYSLTALTLADSAVHGNTAVYWDGTAWRSSGGTQRQYQTNFFTGTMVLPSKLRADSYSTAFLRGNMYFPHSRGVLRAGVAADTEWKAAGLDSTTATIFQVTLQTTGTIKPLLVGTQWVYRTVPVRTDVNGMVVRGRPSGGYIFQNTLADCWTFLQIHYQRGWGNNDADTIEVYRTRAFPNAIQPDDEMMLVATVAVPAGSSSGYVNVEDRTTDAQRGVALYTSPSRGGVQMSNDPPPACAFVETYRGCLFFGNIAGSHRKTFSYNLADASGSTTGVGYRQATATTTAGSPTLTAVTPIAGVQVGMLLDNVGSPPPRVIAIAGTTVTLSSNYPTTGAGVTVRFQDAVELNGTWVALASIGLHLFPFYVQFYMRGELGCYLITPSITGKRFTAVVEDPRPNGSAFTIRATHGDEFEPPLPLAGATAETSDIDIYPNGLIYSEPDQPEHVPPKNFVLVADKNKAIIGLCATRDSLFIFKEDGIWRLSGINGEWRIDPFDLTTFCVLPSSIKRLDNAIYMLSNKGVVRVSELGVELLSAPIQNMVAKLVDDALSNFTSLGYYKLTGMDGCAAAVDARNNEYLLSVGTNTLKSGGQILVYNARTDAWTTFSASATGAMGYVPTGLGVSATGAPLILHAGGVRASSYAAVTVGNEPSYNASDGTTAITVTSVVNFNNGTAQLVHASGGVFQEGDTVVMSGGATYVITAIISPTDILILVPSTMAVPVASTATVWRSQVCTVQPHGFSNPMFTGKQWTHTLIAFTRFLGPVRTSIGYASSAPLIREASQLLTEDEPFYVYTGYAMYMLGSLFRQTVPKAHARSWLLRPTLRWYLPFGETVLDTIAVDSRDYAGTKDQMSSRSEG